MKIVVNARFNNLERFMREVDRRDLDFRLMGAGGFAGRLVSNRMMVIDRQTN